MTIKTAKDSLNSVRQKSIRDYFNLQQTFAHRNIPEVTAGASKIPSRMRSLMSRTTPSSRKETTKKFKEALGMDKKYPGYQGQPATPQQYLANKMLRLIANLRKQQQIITQQGEST